MVSLFFVGVKCQLHFVPEMSYKWFIPGLWTLIIINLFM